MSASTDVVVVENDGVDASLAKPAGVEFVEFVVVVEFVEFVEFVVIGSHSRRLADRSSHTPTPSTYDEFHRPRFIVVGCVVHIVHKGFALTLTTTLTTTTTTVVSDTDTRPSSPTPTRNRSPPAFTARSPVALSPVTHDRPVIHPSIHPSFEHATATDRATTRRTHDVTDRDPSFGSVCAPRWGTTPDPIDRSVDRWVDRSIGGSIEYTLGTD